jgi:hypothetical protein
MTMDLHQRQIRCPRLGSGVTFGYCLGCGEAQAPCFKICDCWWEQFDVVGYLENHLGPEAVATLAHARPKPKVVSLIEMIEQAQKSTEACGDKSSNDAL